jgi:hypothetical protein
MRQKLITLDPTSFEIAQSMPNFSEWVRIQLQNYRSPQQMELDLEYYEAKSVQQSKLLQDIVSGRKEWSEKSGWISCGEEE